MIKIISFLFAALTLSGCIAFIPMPPFSQYLSPGAAIASYATTGKGTSDHVISAIVDKDCVLHRAVTDGDVCINYPPEEPEQVH